MTQLIRCLLCQNGDLSLVPVTHVESWLHNPVFCNSSVKADGVDRQSLKLII